MSLLTLNWMAEDCQRLAECRHDHPFAVLGPQPLESGGWVLRVWMPEAERVELLIDGQSLPMATPNHPWIFEAPWGQRNVDRRSKRGRPMTTSTSGAAALPLRTGGRCGVEHSPARARAGRAKQLAAATQRSELESLARFHSTPSMASSSLA